MSRIPVRTTAEDYIETMIQANRNKNSATGTSGAGTLSSSPTSSTPWSVPSPKEKVDFFSTYSWSYKEKDKLPVLFSTPGRESMSTTACQGSGISGQSPPPSFRSSVSSSKSSGRGTDSGDTDMEMDHDEGHEQDGTKSPRIIISEPNKTYTISNSNMGSSNSNEMSLYSSAMAFGAPPPYTNNWTLWSVWNSVLMNLLNNEEMQDKKRQPMIHMSKEEFGSLVTDVVHKLCAEFEPLGSDFIMIKADKLQLSPQNDRILFIEDFFCYSKFSQKIEIGAEEVMFIGSSFDPEANLILRLVAQQELAQVLASCAGPSDIFLIRGNLEALVYDYQRKALVMNAEVAEHVIPTQASFAVASGSHRGDPPPSAVASDVERLDIIRFPMDDYWRQYFKGRVLVEKIVPAKLTPNHFMFTYTVAEEVTKLSKSTRKSETRVQQKQYSKPKAFALEDFFQRRGTQFAQHMEAPFQIPITRGLGPFDAFRILFESEDLLSLSTAASKFQITPTKEYKVKNRIHETRNAYHNNEFAMITEDEDSDSAYEATSKNYKYMLTAINAKGDANVVSSHPAAQITGRRSSMKSTSVNHASNTIAKRKHRPDEDETDDRRMHLIIIAITLVLILFVLYRCPIFHFWESESETQQTTPGIEIELVPEPEPEIQPEETENYAAEINPYIHDNVEVDEDPYYWNFL